MPVTVTIECSLITDWDSFHDVFAEALGFPNYYGRNGSAWIDCMTNPDNECCNVHLAEGDVLTLNLASARILKERTPEILSSILEMSAFVNFRRVEAGQPSILAISANL